MLKKSLTFVGEGGSVYKKKAVMEMITREGWQGTIRKGDLLFYAG